MAEGKDNLVMKFRGDLASGGKIRNLEGSLNKFGGILGLFWGDTVDIKRWEI